MRDWVEPKPITIMRGQDKTQTEQKNRNLSAVEEPTGLAVQNSRVLEEAGEVSLPYVAPMTTAQKMLAAQYMCKVPKRADQNRFSIEFEFDENDYFDQSWKADFDFDMEEKVLPPGEVGADGEQLMLTQEGTIESFQLPLDACLKTWKTCTRIDASVYQIPWDKNILPGGSKCLTLSLQEQFRKQAKGLTRWACVKSKVADLEGEEQLIVQILNEHCIREGLPTVIARNPTYTEGIPTWFDQDLRMVSVRGTSKFMVSWINHHGYTEMRTMTWIGYKVDDLETQKLYKIPMPKVEAEEDKGKSKSSGKFFLGRLYVLNFNYMMDQKLCMYSFRIARVFLNENPEQIDNKGMKLFEMDACDSSITFNAKKMTEV